MEISIGVKIKDYWVFSPSVTIRDEPGAGKAGDHTAGVKTLLGNPRKAIIKLALPMILAMSVHTVYNLVDAFWVAGIGADALAAVGFFFPFFFMLMALATGLGIGGGAAISRRIGAGDKTGADNVGSHTFVLLTLFAVLITIPLFMFSQTIFQAMGAEGQVLEWSTSYARILFAGTVAIFFSNVSNAILRSEGDVKRAMTAMVSGGVLNIILDPIFIFGPGNPGPWGSSFGLGLGVTGAAWATLISLSVTSAMLFYWLFLKRSTYLDFRFRGFRFDKGIIKDIFKVGLPSSVQQLSMSFTMIIMILIIVGVAGTDGVAVYTTGWRISSLGILPLLGISTAVVSVTGAMYGRKRYDKLDSAYLYAIKVGLYIEIAVAIFIFIFAGLITCVFTHAPGTMRIAPDLVMYFKITCLFYPGVAFGMLTGAMFQGTGKGMNALAVTILRTLVLTPPLALAFAYVFDLGLSGIWWGFVIANLIGSIIAFGWGRRYIRRLKREGRN